MQLAECRPIASTGWQPSNGPGPERNQVFKLSAKVDKVVSDYVECVDRFRQLEGLAGWPTFIGARHEKGP